MDRENNLSKKSPVAAIKEIRAAKTLVELDGLLTASMAQQQIQALIKEERLDSILKKVKELAETESESENAGLLVLALLGRLSAVARGRETEISKTLPMLVSVGSLPPLESSTLDGDGKFYAAQSLSQMGSVAWATYAFEESVNVDTAEKARKSLIEMALNSCSTAAEAFVTHCSVLENLVGITNAESRLRKAKRISSGWAEVMRGSNHELGDGPGEALAKWIAALLAGDIRDVDETLLFNIVDDGIDILLRFIELRFSHAMLTETYQMLSRAKVILGRARWIHFLPFSKNRQALTLCLREAALVLARQGKTDKTLLDLIQLMYQSKVPMINDMERHFGKAMELDPEVRQWWLAGGAVSNSRQTVHKVGNTEDQMIGELLLEVQSAKPFMNFLQHSIVPMIDISDSVMSTNGIKAAAGYSEIARKVDLLARMRKLSTTDLKGSVVEFNPFQHELLSDTPHGIREVKVTRDGVLKDFGGNIKTLVKPRVEPLS
ncbi:hypothetical protein OH708_21270 [Pseudomonas capsici]|uniref:hypothetical protein n=1 Tax=Pseudomonas capsici TaxID=2810614 RepID=UPI0021F134B7|nr:hypothetical protein [Pseudomonas capsici]MCV4290447.1 hypothetical protein [Pseudomonas capsici]